MRRHSFEVCKFVKMLTILTGNTGILEHASALEIFLFQISLHIFSVDVRLSKSEHNPDLKSWTWMARAAARRRRREKERRPILFAGFSLARALASPWVEFWLLLGWRPTGNWGPPLLPPYFPPPPPFSLPSSLIHQTVRNISMGSGHMFLTV